MRPPPATLGSACTADSDCAFSDGQTGFCYGYDRDDKGAIRHGYCSQKCGGLCPGSSTFCTAVTGEQGGTGFCAIKSSSSSDCALYPSSVGTDVERYIGNSTAKPSTSNVCLHKLGHRKRRGARGTTARRGGQKLQQAWRPWRAPSSIRSYSS